MRTKSQIILLSFERAIQVNLDSPPFPPTFIVLHRVTALNQFQYV